VIAAYQGIDGSHFHVVLAEHFARRGEQVELCGVTSFRDVAVAVTTGRARYGLLPVDNSTSGTFRDGYDLMDRYGLSPVREIVSRLDERLLGVDGATLAGLRRIYAHPIALEECSRFLATLPGAEVLPTADTGDTARQIAETKNSTWAVIGPAEAASRWGLIELAPTVADSRHNFTRFILIEATPETDRTPSDGGPRRTSLLLRTRNEDGALTRILAPLAEAQINIAKIESRVQPGRPWEAAFYLDLDADVNETGFWAALQAMRHLCSGFRVLGSYDRDAGPLRPSSAPSAAAASTDFQALPSSCTQVTLGSLQAGAAADDDDPAAVPPPTAKKNWPRASREQRPWGTIVRIGDVEIGGDEFVVIAGPCSVESRDQVIGTALAVRERGATLLRGGAFKPRTTPYAFQGLGWEGVDLLQEASRVTGLPTVSEVMNVDQVERMARSIDVLQIGARNMQNFDLLRAVGRAGKPVLLKRGMSATLNELLAAAEYILSEGNPDVILCERGIRTFETSTRNTLDLSAIPVLREQTHLPILVDPSHGVGVRRWIRPLARAAKAVGAHGIIVEVHPNPPKALSDADQALRFDQFGQIMDDLRAIPPFSM